MGDVVPQRVEVVLSDEEREVLERWAHLRARSARAALPDRAGSGRRAEQDIAARPGCSTQTVGRWRGRFARRGLDGLHDEPRPGKPRSIGDDDVERVIVKTLED
jgi:transposase